MRSQRPTHTVALWDTRVRARLGTDLNLGRDRLTGAVFGRDGVLAVVTIRGALKVGDLDPAQPGHVTANQVEPNGVEQVAASPDGRRLVVATRDGVAAAALTSEMAPPPLLRPLTLAQDVSVSSDGVVAAADKLQTQVVQRWNAEGNRLPSLEPPALPLGTTPPPFGQTWSAAISADGRSVAAGYWSGAIVLWQPAGDGAPTGVRLDDGNHHEPVNDLVFDPDGAVLASGDGGGTIELWRVGRRGPPKTLLGHEGEVTSLAFAPGGEMLASGGEDGTVRLWDPRNARALGEPLRLAKPVSSVAFSPDGRWLVASPRRPRPAHRLGHNAVARRDKDVGPGAAAILRRCRQRSRLLVGRPLSSRRLTACRKYL